MKVQQRTLTIQSVKQIASGNWLVNGNTWFTARDMRNALLGLGLTGNIMAAALLGSSVSFTECNVSDEDIAKGSNKAQLPVPYKNRFTGELVSEITFKKPGMKWILIELQLSEKVTDKVIEATVLQSSVEKSRANQNRMYITNNRLEQKDDQLVEDIPFEEAEETTVVQEEGLPEM